MMKRLIRNILIFVVLLIAADLTFGIAMRYMQSHARGGRTKTNYYSFTKTNEDILLFGSSRCLHHYNPAIISDSTGMTCQNVGLDGYGIIYHYAKLTSILQFHTPKVIVYDLVKSFDIDVDASFDKYVAGLRPFYGLGKTEDIVEDIDHMERYKNISSLYKYNRVFLEILIDNVRPMISAESNGYAPMDKEMTIIPEIHQDTLTKVMDPTKKKYFQKFINICKEKNIKLIFAVSPSYKKTSAIAYEPIRKMCEEESIPFLDYYSCKDIVDNKDFFADSFHLNRKGADKFSQLFASELKSYIQK